MRARHALTQIPRPQQIQLARRPLRLGMRRQQLRLERLDGHAQILGLRRQRLYGELPTIEFFLGHNHNTCVSVSRVWPLKRERGNVRRLV